MEILHAVVLRAEGAENELLAHPTLSSVAMQINLEELLLLGSFITDALDSPFVVSSEEEVENANRFLTVIGDFLMRAALV